MKAKDLMIGNYINAWLIDGSWQVIKVDSGKKLDFIYMQESNNIYKPIPITEDWLVKFNFDLGWIIEHNTESFCLIQQGVNYYYSADMHHHTSKPMKYIHQLQNLFFALTGKELTTS